MMADTHLCSFHKDYEADYSLIHHAAYSGNYAFVSQKVSISPSLLKPNDNFSLLVSASLGDYRPGSANIELTKFLLERGASPNEQLPQWQFNVSCPESLMWTPWTLFLLGSTTVISKSAYNAWFLELPKPELLEVFLRNDADASVCFLGYQTKNDKEERVVLGGPFYMTLEQLMDIWAPSNAETIRQLPQRKPQKSSMNLFNWIGSTIDFWGRQQPRIPECQIKRFEVDKVLDTDFTVTSVASMGSLGKLKTAQIEILAAAVEKGGSKILKSRGLAIRVA
jgi:hypothetical protein